MLFLSAALAPAPAAAEILSHAPDGRPLTLTFADEFQSFRPLGTPGGIWRTTYGDGTQKGLDRRTLPDNGEAELYVDARLADDKGVIGLDPFRVHDGVLDIVASPTPAALKTRLGGLPYVSGVITSQPSFSQTYGYFEMRAKLPSGKGLWPAFWLLPRDMSWPPEIDVMESVNDGGVVTSTVHSTLPQTADGFEARISRGAFHTFAVAWDRSRIGWYVDNRRIGEQQTPADLNKPMFLIANLAIAGRSPGPPDAATIFPATLSIDYIHAYQFSRT